MWSLPIFSWTEKQRDKVAQLCFDVAKTAFLAGIAGPSFIQIPASIQLAFTLETLMGSLLFFYLGMSFLESGGDSQ